MNAGHVSPHRTRLSRLCRPASRRRWALAAATTILVLGHAGSAAAQSGNWWELPQPQRPAFVPGEVYAEEHTFQAPAANILERLTASTKTVTISIHRTSPSIIGMLHELDVNWSIGAGPATSFPATAKDVEFASGRAHFDVGDPDAEITVTLKARPSGDDQERQFTLNLSLPEGEGNASYYDVRTSSVAQRLTAAPGFNCELRDRLMSIQVPSDGDETWCPVRDPGGFTWTHPVMVNGIRFQPSMGTKLRFDTERHVLSSGGGQVTPILRCSSCRVGAIYARTTLEWTSDNSGPEKSLKASGESQLFGFSFAAVTVQPIKFTDSYSALLPVYLYFPEAIRRFSPFTTDVVLRSQNPTGLVLEDLHVHADAIPFGAFSIRPLDLYYHRAEDLWGAHVGVGIPIVPGAAELRQQTIKNVQTDLRVTDPNIIERGLKVTRLSPGVQQYAQDKLTDFFFQDSITVDAKLEVTGAGQLRRLELGSTFTPPIPLGLPGIGLYSLRGTYMNPFSATVGPFAVSGPFGVLGAVEIAAGPRIGKYPAFTFQGTLGYLAPSATTGWQLLATGSPKLFGIELASGGLHYVNGQSLTARFALSHGFAAGGFELGFDAEVEATMFFDPLDFFALAGGGVRIKTPDLPPQPFCVGFCFPSKGLDINARGAAAVNKNGFSACSNGMGLKYTWADEKFEMFLGCDNDRLRSAIGARAAAARSGSATAGAAAAGTRSHSVTVAQGAPYEVLRVVGAEGPPELRIEGPGGFRFETPEDRGPLVGERRAVRFVQAPGNVTWVQIVNPRAGRYRITPIRRSAIASLAHASGLRAPVVRASVSGRGATRTLRYRISQDDSQSVTLVERAGPTERPLRTIRGSQAGTIRFRPAVATAAGRRSVGALLQTRGTPAGRRTLARYTFTEPRVGKPRIAARARRGLVRLSWERVHHAIGYELEVALSDGQRLFFPAPAKQRALKLSTVASRQNGIVTIRAIDRLHRKGPAAQVRFRAARRR